MTNEDVILPLVEETLTVGKRTVETGRVRVDVRVEPRDEIVRDTLMRDDVIVERHAIGRVVDAVPPTREEGAITIIPVVEERLVVRRELVLVEEVRIIRDRRAEPFEQTVRLHTQTALITRTNPTGDPA